MRRLLVAGHSIAYNKILSVATKIDIRPVKDLDVKVAHYKRSTTAHLLRRNEDQESLAKEVSSDAVP